MWKSARVCARMCVPLFSVSVKTARTSSGGPSKRPVTAGTVGMFTGKWVWALKTSNRIRSELDYDNVCVFANTELDFTSLRFPWYNISKLPFICVYVCSSLPSEGHSALRTCHRTSQNITTQKSDPQRPEHILETQNHMWDVKTHVCRTEQGRQSVGQ